MYTEDFEMKNVALAEDDECWSIAESMMEEIELIKGKKIGKLLKDAKLEGSFKRMLMRRVRLARAKKTIGH
jgi:hypothetical protein